MWRVSYPSIKHMADLEIPTELLESPSFQLERLRRRTRDAVESQISAKHVSLREYWVLSCLMSTDAPSQSALCEVLAYDASDMVRLVDALEKKGWVKRAPDCACHKTRAAAAG